MYGQDSDKVNRVLGDHIAENLLTSQTPSSSSASLGREVKVTEFVIISVLVIPLAAVVIAWLVRISRI